MSLTSPLFLEVDDLYCSEEQWEEDEEAGDVVESSEGCFSSSKNGRSGPLFELPEQHEVMTACDEELREMFLKEGQAHMFKSIEKDQALVESRHGAVDWILKVRSFYSFSALTALLAVNYLDRFIFLSLQQSFQREKPWMTQLAAVACLSLAAKVEEVHVPLLLDLQVVEAEHVFEAKTIQKMEILVLSTLGWKMSPVNPLTFLDQFTSKLGWSGPIYGEFTQRCELVMLLALFDCRNMSFLPSVTAATTMLHVIGNLQPSIVGQLENRLLGTLGIDKEKVSECYGFIRGLISRRRGLLSRKRKFGSLPGSPTGVMEASFSADSSNSSWSAASSVTSSPEPPCSKRGSRPHCPPDEA
uniref:Cyclin N-terminal domain-containing protein n=1 Tax=Kalanchoe fedtschenkoi TaxID=63787 RepID=A0A7N0ZQ96_KALFE